MNLKDQGNVLVWRLIQVLWSHARQSGRVRRDFENTGEVLARAGRGSGCLFVKIREQGHSRQREQPGKAKGHEAVSCLPGSASFL